MVPASPVELIKSKVDLVGLVGGYVPGLKKSGRNWWACCPFHAEKTPSFCIWPEDDRWKCFGCNESGDAFSFVMRMENLDFPGALKLLAEKAGVLLEDRPRKPEDTQRKHRLLELNAAASLWFHGVLLEHPSAAKAREFVERRHLVHQTVTDFQLGYAPDSWDALRSHLSQRGYAVEEQLASGVLHESERGQPYDRFRNRLIYPIKDAGGHIVAFGGRDLGDEKRSAKFINSPQTELFDKSAILYGLDRAKNAIRERDQVIVVEGYMDAIMAHQHGETNVVCSMGTSMTERQLEQIKRLSTNLVICLDPDTAGDLGADRGVEVARGQVFDHELVPVPSVNGLVRLEARLKADIRIMSLPRGKDPDEVIHEDPAEWRRLVTEALPLLEYKFQQIVARHDSGNARDKRSLVEELGAELALIPDRLERHHYIGKVTQHLSQVAGTFQLREADLQDAVMRAAARTPTSRRRTEPKPDTPTSAQDRPNTAPVTHDAEISLSKSPHSQFPVPNSLPLRLDAEDFLVMRALRYLDDAHLWSQNSATDEVVKSENREVLKFLRSRLDQGLPLAPSTGDLPAAIAEHVTLLQDLGAREPEIPEASRAAEFDRLLLTIQKQGMLRKQLERATRFAQTPDDRPRHLEAGALADLADLHAAQTELTRRTLLTQPS